MENGIIQRINKLILEYRLSLTTLSKKIGIPQPTLYRQMSGDSTLSLNTIYAILHHFPDISAEWLLRGTGEMQLSDNAQPQQENNSPAIINGKFEVDGKGYLRLKFNKI